MHKPTTTGTDPRGTFTATSNTTITTLLTSATVGNSVTTQYNVTTAYSCVDTETHAEGYDTTGGAYDFTKTSLSIRSWEETGTILSGAFTRTGTGEDDSTATEYNNYPDGSADFTEIINEDFAYTTTGNRVLGTYTDNDTGGIRTTTLTAHTHDSGGGWDYTVTQSTLGTFWRSNTGYANGTYAHTEGAADDYTVTQSGADTNYDYLLTITGTNSYSTDTSGDIYTALFTTTKTGSADNYEMNEAGTHSGGAYTQNIVGEETYTQIDFGNTITANYTRQITGGGDWTSTNTGATPASDTGTTNYTWNQTGDPGSGTFTLSQSGTSRYGLLQDFKDISNTQSGQTPGHMNVYPFGQAFVDPNNLSPDSVTQSVNNAIASGNPATIRSILSLVGNSASAELRALALQAAVRLELAAANAAAAAALANKLNHLFSPAAIARHNLGALLTHFGNNQQSAYSAIHNAAVAAVRQQGLTGIVENLVVQVGGMNVTVSGAVVDGYFRLGTCFIPR